eukprot:13183548-Heterocapsa_arctica.AAC.1
MHPGEIGAVCDEDPDNTADLKWLCGGGGSWAGGPAAGGPAEDHAFVDQNTGLKLGSTKVRKARDGARRGRQAWSVGGRSNLA